MIERIPRSHRYRLTDLGLRVSLFYSRVYGRILRPGLAQIAGPSQIPTHKLRASFDALDVALNDWCKKAKLVA
ncbi:MAG: hypothetical protein PHU25_15770 [Deltaproteobacteria bacterium]|nr:hypothetical protein [Deltaproteobacteria bacterium]